MKKTSNIMKIRLIALCLISAMAISAVSCGKKENPKAFSEIVSETNVVADGGSDLDVNVGFNAVVGQQGNVKAGAEEDAAQDGAVSSTEMIEVPVFVTDIAKGTKITSSKVTTKLVRADSIPSTVITDKLEIVGTYAAIKLFKGDFAYEGKLVEKLADVPADVGNAEKTKVKYLDVSQYVKPNTGQDLYAVLQELIDLNPKRTLYFPDGEYIISKPLQLSAVPTKSNSLYLSDNAVIKASDYWGSTNTALITLGVADDKSQNDITSIGSNYSIIGGTLDGNKKAMGINLVAGREVLISKVKIVDMIVGIKIGYGINSGSSDMDIEDIDIIGFGSRSKGIVIEGYDNNIVDVRISNVATGIQTGSGNFFRGVSVKLTDDMASTSTYNNSVGFQVNGNNWFYSCSTENVATAFSLSGSEMVVKDFIIRWTKAYGAQTAFKTSNRFNAVCSNGIIDFYDQTTQNSILSGASSGNGRFLDVLADTELCGDSSYQRLFYISKTLS